MYTGVHCVQVRHLDLTLCNKPMHDIKKPRGYKPPVAKRKPATHYKLSDGRVIPTFAFMVAVLRYEMSKA